MLTDSNVLEESATAEHPGEAKPRWKEVVAKYEQPSRGQAVWQTINTLVPYAGLWYGMYWALQVSWWLTVPLAILAAGFLVRTFIISHDCGHGSFFKSARANHVLGAFTSLLVFAPYLHWRWEHAVHHATSGDLDRRGIGDIMTLTVEEYLELPPRKRLGYRLSRNPLVLFVLAPLYIFLIKHRFAKSEAGPRQRRSVYWTNLAVVGMVTGMSWIFGFKEYVLLQLLVMAIAGAMGVWLFYVQHQFEGVYWERNSEWDYVTAALHGSSFYKLPRILQWFSGNIGFHHIHHLSSRIPNYNLEKCHKAEPLFQSVKPITLRSSFKSLTFRLWDEQHRRLVGFRRARQRQ